MSHERIWGSFLSLRYTNFLIIIFSLFAQTVTVSDALNMQHNKYANLSSSQTWIHDFLSEFLTIKTKIQDRPTKTQERGTKTNSRDSQNQDCVN